MQKGTETVLGMQQMAASSNRAVRQGLKQAKKNVAELPSEEKVNGQMKEYCDILMHQPVWSSQALHSADVLYTWCCSEGHRQQDRPF
jgi:hypothetical protein